MLSVFDVLLWMGIVALLMGNIFAWLVVYSCLTDFPKLRVGAVVVMSACLIADAVVILLAMKLKGVL